MARKFSELRAKMSRASAARARVISEEIVAEIPLAKMKRPPTHPGEILADALDGRELSGAEAARRMKVPARLVYDIVGGRRTVTADTAVRLAELFDMSPEFWMNLSVRHDLWHAMRLHATRKLAKKR